MLNCDSLMLNGLDLGCGNGIGGIKEVYITTYDSLSGTPSFDDEAGTVNNLNVSKKFKVYKFRKATGSLTSTLNIDDSAGTSYIQSDLSLQFNKYADVATRLEIQALSISNLIVIVKTNNGQFVYLGADNPVTATAGGGQTGQAYADGSFYNITLTDISRNYPYIVDETTISRVVEL